MDQPTPRTLLTDAIKLQAKFLVEAARDLVLGPLSLAAAALDALLIKHQSPRYFDSLLRFGTRSDQWIDLWSAARRDGLDTRSSVDTLLANVEQAIADPKAGARRARVLKRWAERQLRRTRTRPDPTQ